MDFSLNNPRNPSGRGEVTLLAVPCPLSGTGQFPRVLVNGIRLKAPQHLNHGDRILVGCPPLRRAAREGPGNRRGSCTPLHSLKRSKLL